MWYRSISASTLSFYSVTSDTPQCYPGHIPLVNDYIEGTGLQIVWIIVGYYSQAKSVGPSSKPPSHEKDVSQGFIFTLLWVVVAQNHHMALRLSGLGGKDRAWNYRGREWMSHRPSPPPNLTQTQPPPRADGVTRHAVGEGGEISAPVWVRAILGFLLWWVF